MIYGFRALGVFAVMLMCSCGGEGAGDAPRGDGEEAAGVMKVVTTIGMVNDVVARVAGQHASCANLIGEGVDPHLYKPTSSDVIKLLGADAVFYSGLRYCTE